MFGHLVVCNKTSVFEVQCCHHPLSPSTYKLFLLASWSPQKAYRLAFTSADCFASRVLDFWCPLSLLLQPAQMKSCQMVPNYGLGSWLLVSELARLYGVTISVFVSPTISATCRCTGGRGKFRRCAGGHCGDCSKKGGLNCAASGKFLRVIARCDLTSTVCFTVEYAVHSPGGIRICATRWSRFTARANVYTTSIQWTDALFTRTTVSRRGRYLSDMPAPTMRWHIHHDRMERVRQPRKGSKADPRTGS